MASGSDGLSRPSPPDTHKYEKEVALLTQLIKEKELLLEPVPMGSVELSEQLVHVKSDLEEAEEKRSKVIAEMRAIEEEIKRINVEVTKQKEEASRHGVGLKYKNDLSYEEQIVKLEAQVESHRFSTTDEKKLRREVDNLKKGREKLKDYLKHKEAIDRGRTKQDELRAKKDSLYKKSKHYKERSGSIKADIESIRQQLDGNRDKRKEKIAAKDNVFKEIEDLYKQRKTLQEQFRQQQLDYMEAMKASKKEKIVESKSPRLRKLTSRHEMPRELHHDEKEICHTLVAYLNRFITPSPSASPTLNPATPPQTLSPATSDTKSYVIVPRKEEEELVVAPFGRREKRRSKRDKKRGASVKVQNRLLQHNATMASQFSRIGLKPPSTTNEVPVVLSTIKNKLLSYDSRPESEAGDSGIMSSTGISEYSDLGIYSESDLASGQNTPLHKRGFSPLPPHIQPLTVNSEDGSVTNSEENSSSVVDDTDTIVNGGLEIGDSS